MSSAKTTTKVLPNTNRQKTTPNEPLEVYVAQRSAKDNSQRLWTGQRVLRGGRLNPKPPSESRVAKEALYRTGAARVWQRKSGTGRPLNEKPKKSGKGGHNWGFPGIEVGVELATKDELREIEREFNPTAPDPEEAREQGESIFDEGEEWADEQYLGDESGYWRATDLSGWEGMIAGTAFFPGYERGIESIRTLWGEEAVSSEYFAAEEERADRLDDLWRKSNVREREQQGEEDERTVALAIGGPPKWSEEVRWGDRSARKTFSEGVPVIPWGESLPHEEITGAPPGFAAGASMKEIEGLPEQGYTGLEAELTAGRGSSLDANFANREIRTEIKFDPRAATTGKDEERKIETKSKQGTFNMGESVSLPSA